MDFVILDYRIKDGYFVVIILNYFLYNAFNVAWKMCMIEKEDFFFNNESNLLL